MNKKLCMILLGTILFSTLAFFTGITASASAATIQPPPRYTGDYSKGYNDGYQAGYHDGSTTCSRSKGYHRHEAYNPTPYDRGYQVGYEAGFNDGLTRCQSHQKTYADGFRDGYQAGYHDSSMTCSRSKGYHRHETYNPTPYDRGYADGYETGFNRGLATCRK